MSKAIVLDEGKWKESSSRRLVRKVSVLEKNPFKLANAFYSNICCLRFRLLKLSYLNLMEGPTEAQD